MFFLPVTVSKCCDELETDGLLKRADVSRVVVDYYQTSIDYIEQWGAHFATITKFQWAVLTKSPTWSDMQLSLKWFAENMSLSTIDDSALFDETVNVKAFVDDERLQKWTKEQTSPDQRWVEVFTHFDSHNIGYTNILKLVEFCFCLPGTNAPTERVFSLMNDMWTSEKTQLAIDTLSAVLVTKVNFGYSCVEFYDVLLNRPRLLKALHSSEKYKAKSSSDSTASASATVNMQSADC